MSSATLDSVPALVLIDLQKGIVGMQLAHPVPPIVDRAAQLARAFRAHQFPVALVNAAGRAPGRTAAEMPAWTFPPDWTDLAPELDPSPGDHLVTKHRWGAFLGTDLHSYLQAQCVTQIVLGGISTSIGVESTARSAYDLGYNVLLVTDAMTDREIEAHRYSIEKIFPRMGEMASTAEVLQLIGD